MKRRILERKCRPLKVVLQSIEDQDQKVALLEYWLDRLRYHIVVDHKSELELFVERYKAMEKETLAKTGELSAKIVELRRQLKSGTIGNKQYQEQLTPLKREKKATSAALLRFEFSTLDKIFPDHFLTVDEVVGYLDEEREWRLKCLSSRKFGVK